MNYITNFFRVGCVALLAMLILAPGAFAQQAPDPPTDLEARAGAVDETTGDQHGRITLTWSPVPEANNGGFDVTDYVIEFTADPTDANFLGGGGRNRNSTRCKRNSSDNEVQRRSHPP